MKNISVCIIAKNEEKYIRNCLEALKPYDMEIVVVDTGSTDKTVEIAKEYTNSVYFFEWINNFSAARNYAAKMAKNNYIFALDCDEFLDVINFKEIEWLLKEHPNATGNIERINIIKRDDSICKNRSFIPRIYDKRFFKFVGSIHEQLRLISPGKSEFGNLDVVVTHWGYYYTDEESLRKKNIRNIELLLKDLEKEPNNQYTLFQLGQSYYSLREVEKAFEMQSKALKLPVNGNSEYERMLIIGYGTSCLDLGKYTEALKLEEYYDMFFDLSDYMLLLGKTYFANKRYDDALMAFELAMQAPHSIFDGTNSYFAMKAISVLYETIGDKVKAVEFENKASASLEASNKRDK